MNRLNAHEFYRFDTDYFMRLAKGLSDALVLINVLDPSGNVVSQALMLCGTTYGHYHLSARASGNHNVASHLLFEAMADEAAERGLTSIHLGGGTTSDPNDSLLTFKRRIGRAPSSVRTAGLVCNPAEHERLRTGWIRRSGRSPCWFQSYREPLTET